MFVRAEWNISVSPVLEFLFKRQYIHFCKMLRRAKKHIFVSQEAANLDIAF